MRISKDSDCVGRAPVTSGGASQLTGTSGQVINVSEEVSWKQPEGHICKTMTLDIYSAGDLVEGAYNANEKTTDTTQI